MRSSGLKSAADRAIVVDGVAGVRAEAEEVEEGIGAGVRAMRGDEIATTRTTATATERTSTTQIRTNDYMHKRGQTLKAH